MSLMKIEKNIAMILWNVGNCLHKTQCSILEDESSVLCLRFIFVCCWVWDIFAPVNSTALGINVGTLTTSLTIYAVYGP
jgi:hypothetical protein